MVQNKAEIASKSIYNPRASRALERALDPGRKRLRASLAHFGAPPETVLALSGCTGVSSGPSEKKFEKPCPRVLDALSSYMSRILNHSDTKRDFKNIVDQTLEGGGGCCAPAWIRHSYTLLEQSHDFTASMHGSVLLYFHGQRHRIFSPIDMRCDMSASLPPYPTRDSARSIIDSNIFT